MIPNNRFQQGQPMQAQMQVLGFLQIRQYLFIGDITINIAHVALIDSRGYDAESGEGEFIIRMVSGEPLVLTGELARVAWNECLQATGAAKVG